MAQQVEHVLGKDEVAGSNPAISSKKTTRFGGFFFILSLNMGFQGNAHRYNCIQSGTIANFLSMNCEVELFLDCLSVRNALILPYLHKTAYNCKRPKGRVIP